MLACLKKSGDSLTNEICGEIGDITVAGDVYLAAKKVLQIFIKFHDTRKKYHDEVMSLQYTDEDVKNHFMEIEKTMMDAVAAQIGKSGFAFKHEREQKYLIFTMVKGIEDQLAFNLNPDFDKDILIDECAAIVTAMLIRVKN